MRGNIHGVLILLASAGMSEVHAQDAQSESPPATTVHMEATLSLPPGVMLREILRLHRPSSQTFATLWFWPQNWEEIGWKMGGSLGFISAAPFENSAPIYWCWGITNWDMFSSLDPNCEGGYRTPDNGPVGFISTVQLPGTTPLYRCVFKWNGTQWRHFDSLQANCEGVPAVTNDGTLGYVFL